MSPLIKSVITLVPLLLAEPALANPKNIDELYQQGISQLRGEQFSQALISFDNAERAGLTSSALYYNQGVALYRLKQYDQALAAFSKALKNTKQTALVYYNLGLVNAQLKNDSAAINAFSNAASLTSNEKLADNANKMISSLEKKPKKKGSKKIPLTFSADAKVGHDNNVTLANTELAQASNLSDLYYDLYAAVKYQISGKRNNGYWAQIGASTVQYQEYDIYNYTLYSGSIFRDKQYGPTDTRMGVKYERSYFGGSDYLDKLTARFQVRYALNKQQKLRARYDFTRYDELDPQYSYLAGTRSKLKLDSTWRTKRERIRLGYELELNNRDDATTLGNFTSYSATRHKLYSDYIVRINKAWEARLGLSYRQSNYNDANIVANITSPVREDQRLRFSTSGKYHLNRHLSLVAEYHYSDNDSNVATKQYQRHQFLLGVQGYY